MSEHAVTVEKTRHPLPDPSWSSPPEPDRVDRHLPLPESQLDRF